MNLIAGNGLTDINNSVIGDPTGVNNNPDGVHLYYAILNDVKYYCNVTIIKWQFIKEYRNSKYYAISGMVFVAVYNNGIKGGKVKQILEIQHY